MTKYENGGDLTPGSIEKFISLIDKKGEEGCWLWTGKCFPNGYGKFRAIRNSGGGGTQSVHRVAWELFCGEIIRRDHCVCHRCDVRRCTNPKHLFLGTAAENVRDWVSKGQPGRPPKKSYTSDDFRSLYWVEKVDVGDIAETYHLDIEAVETILELDRDLRDRSAAGRKMAIEYGNVGRVREVERD